MTCALGIFGLPHFWAVAEVVCVVVWFALAVLVWSGSVGIAVIKLAHSRYECVFRFDPIGKATDAIIAGSATLAESIFI